MKLNQLLQETATCLSHGNPELNPEITHLTYDSRTVREGSLFFATDGVHTDGHAFIDRAVQQGAKAVVHSKPLSRYADGIAYIQVPSPRRALSPFARAFYRYPDTAMTTVGVTGTDGKSTTVSFICQLLEQMGQKAGYLSTVAFKTDGAPCPNPLRQSTPEAIELQSMLADMRNSGCRYAVIEATSHGLSPKNNRLGGVAFDAALLTNVTREHLEFHGTVEQYRQDKAELFKKIKPGGFGVVNANEPHKQLFIDAAPAPVFQYALTDTRPNASAPAAFGDVAVECLSTDASGSAFLLHLEGDSLPASLSIPALFNIENAAAAYITVYHLLKPKCNGDPAAEARLRRELASRLTLLQPVTGRMNRIQHRGQFQAIVDYAHTPGAFERLLPAMKAQTQGRLMVLFGSAGERDTEKRPLQGEIADRFADILILTDEDPRLEDSMEIINQIAMGCPHKTEGSTLFKIPDRSRAIQKAVSLAQAGDTLLFLGKGHEQCIFYADGKHPWDEAGAVRAALTAEGY